MNRTALLALAAAALVACSGQEPTTKCSAPEDCPAGSRCLQAVCVENRAPAAAIDPLTSVEAYALVTLSGAASTDPDDGDAIVAYHWTVQGSGAACEPPVIAGTTAAAQVRFACIGSYEVRLVVEDVLGALSEPAVATVNVVPASTPSGVSAGADVTAGHTCAGLPLRCRPATEGGAVALTGTSTLGAGVSYRWIVQPPEGRELAAGRRVTFSPGVEVLSPTVALETDGLAISGDWVFRLEAYDAYGVVGAAATRVSITNDAPTVSGTVDPVPHVYVATAQRFEAPGTIHVTVTDPDGDPVVRRVGVHQLNAGASSTFQANDLGDTISFSIVVPYDAEGAPLRLIGGPGLSREVELAVEDVNGAASTKRWPVVVGNRAPVRSEGPSFVAVPHVFDAAASAYVAAATLSTWSDPDGDPLEVAGPSEAPCEELSVMAGTVSATCRVAYAGVPAAGALVGERSIPDGVRDPWTQTSHTTRLLIGDHTPVVKTAHFGASAACTYTGECCDWDTEGCSATTIDMDSSTMASGVWLEDADGDPLAVTFSGGDVTASVTTAVCAPAACQFTFAMPVGTLCNESLVQSTLNATVTDGGAVVQQELTFNRSCE